MSQDISIEVFPVGEMRANCYLVKDRSINSAVIIDPGDDADYLISRIHSNQTKLTLVLATHGHFDHIMAASALQVTFGCPFIIHNDDDFLVKQMAQSANYFLGIKVKDQPPSISRTILGGESIAIGGSWLKVLHTPGHTPGSVSLYLQEKGAVFVGDLLFAGGSVGRTDFSYSNREKLFNSLRQILQLPDSTVCYPGHGESTTVGHEYPLHF